MAPVTIDYYENASESLLRLSSTDRDALSQLRKLFGMLGEGKITFVKLHEQSWVKINPGVIAIYLKLSGEAKERGKLVKMTCNEGGDRTFFLTRYSEGWLEWAEQIDPLLDQFDPETSQVLTGRYADDAVIEVVPLAPI